MPSRQLIANRFELQDLLGRGARSVGEVYRAIDTQTGETLAIKALNVLKASLNPYGLSLR